MVFLMVYIDSCSLLVCQMNIYWDSTVIDVRDVEVEAEAEAEAPEAVLFSKLEAKREAKQSNWLTKEAKREAKRLIW